MSEAKEEVIGYAESINFSFHLTRKYVPYVNLEALPFLADWFASKKYITYPEFSDISPIEGPWTRELWAYLVTSNILGGKKNSSQI